MTTRIKGNDFELLSDTMPYIGVKIVNAKPMNRQEYNDFRNWQLPSDENGSDEGYIVQYSDGYISWSPEQQFNEANRPTNGMTFGLAIEAMKKGAKIQRQGWNDKNMFVVYMPELNLPSYNTQKEGPKVNDRTAKHIGKDTPLESQGYFAMFTAQQKWQPGWLASQSDMLADDWQIVN